MGPRGRDNRSSCDPPWTSGFDFINILTQRTLDEKLFSAHKLGKWRSVFGKFQHINSAWILLVKLNGKSFPNTVPRRLFAEKTKFGEINPRWMRPGSFLNWWKWCVLKKIEVIIVLHIRKGAIQVISNKIQVNGLLNLFKNTVNSSISIKIPENISHVR